MLQEEISKYLPVRGSRGCDQSDCAFGAASTIVSDKGNIKEKNRIVLTPTERMRPKGKKWQTLRKGELPYQPTKETRNFGTSVLRGVRTEDGQPLCWRAENPSLKVFRI